MKKGSLLLFSSIYFGLSFGQATLKLTGGVGLSKNTIDQDVLTQVIQQKQDEVFARLFSNIIVSYFKKNDSGPAEGVYNFTTYYCLYGIMTDLTVGKTKTTVSQSVINSLTELAYIYSFVKYHLVLNGLTFPTQIVTVDNDGKRTIDANKMLELNFYLEAAFDVLANDDNVQKKFHFKRQIKSTEIESFYKAIGLTNNSKFNTITFTDSKGKYDINQLIALFKTEVGGFLGYAPLAAVAKPGSDELYIKTMLEIKKDATGIKDGLTEEQVNVIKLLLLDYAEHTDFLFDQNVVKTLLNLVVENTHFGLDATLNITQVYVDIDGLILSLDKGFIAKNKRSSISSGVWFVNPRLFFTIGTSTGIFLNNNNMLDNSGATPAALKNINLASEKIGFRVKLWDWGYTHSFSPGEVYKAKGYNYVWTQPQKKPLISSVYYNIYGSGLLYNVLNLKTNQNFDFGFVGSNLGLIFFNGLEFSTGLGFVYKDGIDFKNSFFKIDFDIPIIDYLSALTKKK